MGERNSPDAGETTLAAATAAIITARWSGRPPTSGASGDGHGGNGHGSNGHGDGHGLGDGAVSLGEWPAPPPASAALTESTFGNGVPPISPAAPHTPAPPYSPAAPYTPAPPYSPPAPYSPAATFDPAAAPAGVFFSPVAPDPVPEVFDPRAGLTAREPGRDASGAHDDVRTHVPPGFERRDFGPFPGEPGAGGRHAGQAEAVPSGDVRAPEGLLGVLPPAAPSVAPMPASFAPPEPAPWVDAGWVDFPHDLEPHAADSLVGAGAAGAAGTRPVLPRRVPRVPDMDYPLFESDPGEPAPDPATQRQELSRIATFLREPGGDEAPATGPRPDGVDLQAVLGAVRQVPEVRDAQLGWNEQAGHTLRIEFFDGVDESAVTRSVVRLLRSRLGLPNPPGAEEPTLDRPFPSTPGRGTVRPTRSAGAPATGARPLPRPFGGQVPRLVLENVSVTRLGAEANVEVRLRRSADGAPAAGEGRGPGVDAYLSRLAATAAAHAIDRALAERGKVFIEHVSVVPFGVVEVAVVVLLLAYDGVTEQHSGSAIVGDDPHVAVVRATLGAVNRRLESLLG